MAEWLIGAVYLVVAVFVTARFAIVVRLSEEVLGEMDPAERLLFAAIGVAVGLAWPVTLSAIGLVRWLDRRDEEKTSG